MRLVTNEMEPLEVGRHIENMLNSGETRVLPNFPGRNFRNNAKAMFYLNDGKDVVSPFMAGRNGDVVLKTLFQPDYENRKFIEGYLGRPMSPISGIRNDVPASAQPPGLSAVRQPSMKNSMPEIPTSGKSRLPVIAGVGPVGPGEPEYGNIRGRGACDGREKAGRTSGTYGRSGSRNAGGSGRLARRQGLCRNVRQGCAGRKQEDVVRRNNGAGCF